MKSTKFINRIFSAKQNNEEKILTQVYADFKYALEKGNTSTKQLDYVRQPDGTVNVTDKVNKEVTKINEKGDQLVMTPVEGYQIPPKDDIVAELEGTPSIPDDVFPANKGVEDKEKAGLVGNDDTHYPSITFSRVHRTYSQSDYFNCLSEIGITKDMFFSEKDEDKKIKQEKLKEAQSVEKIEREKLKLVKADKDSTKADIMIQEGKALESEGKTQLAKSAVTGALSAGITGAVKGAVLGAAGGPAGIVAGALGGAASGAAISVANSGFESIPKINQGKKLIEQGKKLKEKERHEKKIKESGIDTGKDELDEATRVNSRVGLNDKLQLIVGKMTAIKNAQSNQAKNKIVSEIKDLAQDVKDPNCLRYLKPAIKELEKRSIKDDDFETIVDDLITAFSQNPVTKVFTFSEKVNNI